MSLLLKDIKISLIFPSYRTANDPVSLKEAKKHLRIIPLAIKRNKENIKAATSVPIRAYAISSESSSYRGEYYLHEQNGVITLEYWSPNKLIFRPKAISKDLLVINQNYFAGWKAKSATKSRKVINHNGLLATYIYPEDEDIIFYYFPGTFWASTLVSISGIALSFLIWNKHDLFTLGDICLNENFISKSTI